MKSLFAALAAVCLTLSACTAAKPAPKVTVPAPAVITLWPGAIPDPMPPMPPERTATGTHLIGGKTVTGIDNVSIPTMTVYRARGKNTGAAILVFPGGGYRGLAIDLEGTEVCDWATAKGIACAVLKYRVPGSGPWWDNACRCEHIDVKPRALEDAQRAMGLLRQNAAQYGIDPHKVGVLGFSAGGHMVAHISTHFAKRAYAPVDAADALPCRPDFAVALYPGHMYGGEYPGDHINHDIVDNITADTPPFFVLQNEDDPVDPIKDSMTLFDGLVAKKVPVEYHVYATGGHAFGLRPTAEPSTHWPDLMEVWLRGLKMVP